MTPVKEKVVAAKTATIREMLSIIATLSLSSLEDFEKDPIVPAAAESLLRRALEALLDLGRHILAKGFDDPIAEYGKIGEHLALHGVIKREESVLLSEMGRYRNRLTHFYDEVTREELFHILTQRLSDIEVVLQKILTWLNAHPEKVDRAL